MINKELAQELIDRRPELWRGYRVVSLKDCSHGCDQEVKIAALARQPGDFLNIVIKHPKEEPEKILNQVIGCERAAQKGVPVPRVLYSGQSYLVEEFKPGVILSKLKTSRRNLQAIYLKLGQYLKGLHQNRGKGYGKLRINKLIGQHRTTEAIKQNIQQEFSNLEASQHFSPSFIKRVRRYLDSQMKLLDARAPNSCLLHGDYCQDNILAGPEGVSAIIDFGDLAMGCPSEDFSRLFVNNFGTFRWEALVQGYGAVDLAQVSFYALYLCLWQMNGCIGRGAFRGRLRKLEKVVKAIMGRHNTGQ